MYLHSGQHQRGIEFYLNNNTSYIYSNPNLPLFLFLPLSRWNQTDLVLLFSIGADGTGKPVVTVESFTLYVGYISNLETKYHPSSSNQSIDQSDQLYKDILIAWSLLSTTISHQRSGIASWVFLLGLHYPSSLRGHFRWGISYLYFSIYLYIYLFIDISMIIDSNFLILNIDDPFIQLYSLSSGIY